MGSLIGFVSKFPPRVQRQTAFEPTLVPRHLNQNVPVPHESSPPKDTHRGTQKVPASRTRIESIDDGSRSQSRCEPFRLRLSVIRCEPLQGKILDATRKFRNDHAQLNKDMNCLAVDKNCAQNQSEYAYSASPCLKSPGSIFSFRTIPRTSFC